MANIPTVSWDETNPAGTQDISLGDDRIRELKTQIREVINVDHDFPSTGQAADNGQHKQVTLQEQADLGTGAAGATILGSQTSGGKGELFYVDEDDNDIQLTKGGALYLGSGKLDNDQYLLAVDNAGTGTVNILKVNTSDEVVFGAVATLADGSMTASDAAPTTDTMITNKKYVDDQIAANSAIGQQILIIDQTARSITNTTPFPIDDTAPLWNEGGEYEALEASITPKDATSIIVVEVDVQGVITAGNMGWFGAALFQDPSGSDACVACAHESHQSTDLAGSAGTSNHKARIVYSFVAGGTSAITFKVRVSCTSGDAKVNYVNAITLGNKLSSSIKITEIFV